MRIMLAIASLALVACSTQQASDSRVDTDLANLLAPTLSAATWVQPYGGCKEAYQAPRSAGAKECRDHGWTVRPRLVVNPHGVVKMNSLPSCGVKEPWGTVTCAWNLNGNKRGLSYWVTPENHKPRFVWANNPTRPLSYGWRWVRSPLADVLAEGDTNGATTRDWEQCARLGITVKCADGSGAAIYPLNQAT